MYRSLAVLSALALLAGAEAPSGKNLALVFEDDFEKGAGRWEPTDPKGWKVIETDRGRVFSQFKKASDYKPPHRSPFHIALVKEWW